MPDSKYHVEVWEINSIKRIVHIWPVDHPWQQRPSAAQLIGGVGWVVVQKELPEDNDPTSSRLPEPKPRSSGRSNA